MAVHITSQPLRRRRGGVTEAKLQDVRKAPQAKRRRRRSLPFALRQRGAQRPPDAVAGGPPPHRRFRAVNCQRGCVASVLRPSGGSGAQQRGPTDVETLCGFTASLSLSLPGSIQTQPFPSCNSAANTVREEALAVN